MRERKLELTCSSSTESVISVWNPSTLSVLATYKDSASSSLVTCGDRGFLTLHKAIMYADPGVFLEQTEFHVEISGF